MKNSVNIQTIIHTPTTINNILYIHRTPPFTSSTSTLIHTPPFIASCHQTTTYPCFHKFSRQCNKSTRIEWRRGGSFTSGKLREGRSGHLEEHLGLGFVEGAEGRERESELAAREGNGRRRKEEGLGAGSNAHTSVSSRAAPRYVARR